jgi:hypothetical protein
VKRNGKWTWVAATDSNTMEDEDTMEFIPALSYVEEEE